MARSAYEVILWAEKRLPWYASLPEVGVDTKRPAVEA